MMILILIMLLICWTLVPTLVVDSMYKYCFKKQPVEEFQKIYCCHSYDVMCCMTQAATKEVLKNEQVITTEYAKTAVFPMNKFIATRCVQ